MNRCPEPQEFAQKIAATALSIDPLLDHYCDLATVVHPVPVLGVVSDPDDDLVIGTALAAQAQWMVTGDKQLFSVAEYQGVLVVDICQVVLPFLS